MESSISNRGRRRLSGTVGSATGAEEWVRRELVDGPEGSDGMTPVVVRR